MGARRIAGITVEIGGDILTPLMGWLIAASAAVPGRLLSPIHFTMGVIRYIAPVPVRPKPSAVGKKPTSAANA